MARERFFFLYLFIETAEKIIKTGIKNPCLLCSYKILPAGRRGKLTGIVMKITKNHVPKAMDSEKVA